MKNLLTLPVYIYGELTPISPVLSKARCRIFYKYGNRNGTYITDEFAEKLIHSLSYVPVKGIYEGDDFTDHGESRDDGRIYGIVPETNNFAWEEHEDEDGVTRTYACTDVYVFSALYKEAATIVGKPQSMELYEKTLQYHRETIDGEDWIVFDDGCFLGLQVLGNDVEPCFEGAAFYALQNTIQEAIKQIKEYTLGGNPMFHFALSDSQKAEALWSLLNTKYTEADGWVIDYSICDVYDEYFIAYNYNDNSYEKIGYTKGEDDVITLGERKHVCNTFLTEDELKTVETLRQLNGDTFELVSEPIAAATENFAKIPELDGQIVELNSTLATLNQENENSKIQIGQLESQLEEANATFTAISQEADSLRAFKHDCELKEKNAVLNSYTKVLSEETLNEYRENIETYSAEDLDMHLAYAAKRSGIFSLTPEDHAPIGMVPNDSGKTGVDAILSRYIKS